MKEEKMNKYLAHQISQISCLNFYRHEKSHAINMVDRMFFTKTLTHEGLSYDIEVVLPIQILSDDNTGYAPECQVFNNEDKTAKEFDLAALSEWKDKSLSGLWDFIENILG